MEKKIFNLTPFQSPDRYFYIISGRRSTGKTTLVKKLLKQIKPDISLIFSGSYLDWEEYEQTVFKDLEGFQDKRRCVMVIDGLDREIADMAKENFFRKLIKDLRHIGLTLIITFDPEPDRLYILNKYLSLDPSTRSCIDCVFLTHPISDERTQKRFYEDFISGNFPELGNDHAFTDFCRVFFASRDKKTIAFSTLGLQWLEN